MKKLGEFKACRMAGDCSSPQDLVFWRTLILP